MHMLLVRTRLVFTLGVLLCACDAPRTNPLDPLADGAAAISIKGQVTSFYEPFRPMSGVQVVLSPGSHIVATDASGRFSFRSIAAGDYSLSIDADGFDALDQVVSVGNRPPDDITMRIDALPRILEASIFSVHISRWWPEEDVFLLGIDATMDDDDGIADLDSAWVDIASTYAFRLNATPDPGRYRAATPRHHLRFRLPIG